MRKIHIFKRFFKTNRDLWLNLNIHWDLHWYEIFKLVQKKKILKKKIFLAPCQLFKFSIFSKKNFLFEISLECSFFWYIVCSVYLKICETSPTLDYTNGYSTVDYTTIPYSLKTLIMQNSRLHLDWADLSHE